MSTDTRPRNREARAWLPTLPVPGLLFPAALVAVWEVAVRMDVLTLQYLPAPSAIGAAWVDLATSGRMATDIAHTLSSTLLGWLLGSGLGLLLGLWLGLSRGSWRYGMATVELLRAAPAICFVPVSALLFGFSLRMELAVIIYAAMWPVLVNTVEGIRQVSPLHSEVARVLRLSRAQQVVKVLMPAAAGPILVGLRLSMALALALAVVAEMVGNPAGAGYALILQQQALQPENMFAYIVTIGGVGVLLNAALLAATRVAVPGVAAALKEDA